MTCRWARCLRCGRRVAITPRGYLYGHAMLARRDQRPGGLPARSNRCPASGLPAPHPDARPVVDLRPTGGLL